MIDHQPSGKPPPPVEEDVGPVRYHVFWFGSFHEVVIHMEPPLTLLKRDRSLLDPVRAAGRHPDMSSIVTAREAPLCGTDTVDRLSDDHEDP